MSRQKLIVRLRKKKIINAQPKKIVTAKKTKQWLAKKLGAFFGALGKNSKMICADKNLKNDGFGRKVNARKWIENEKNYILRVIPTF